MNIVHFTDTYFPQINGVTVAVDQFARCMSEEDNNVLIIAPSYSLRSTFTTKGRLSTRLVRSVPFPIYPGIHAAIVNLVTMYRLLRKFKPDVIHIHTPFVLGIIGVLFSQVLNTKLVNTYHTLFSQGAVYFTPQRIIPRYKDSEEDESDHGILAKIIWRLQVIFFNLSDAVIAPTKVIADTLQEQHVKAPIKVIPNGIEVNDFPQKTDYTPTNRIIHLGRLGFEKATDAVLRAFAIVNKKYPETELIIVGDGPAKRSLIKLAGRLGIKNSVNFMGMVDHKKVAPLYRSADLFVTASPFETQGLVLVEAMLSGIPVVAAAINAPVDIITHGKDGYLFEGKHYRECAKYMLSLIENPKDIKRMGMNARKTGVKYDCEKLSNKLVDYYKTL